MWNLSCKMMGVRSAGEGQVSMEVAIELRDTVQRGVRVSRSQVMGIHEVSRGWGHLCYAALFNVVCECRVPAQGAM